MNTVLSKSCVVINDTTLRDGEQTAGVRAVHCSLTPA